MVYFGTNEGVEGSRFSWFAKASLGSELGINLMEVVDETGYRCAARQAFL